MCRVILPLFFCTSISLNAYAADTEVSGKLEVSIKDSLDFSYSVTTHSLIDARGKKYRLIMRGVESDLRSGVQVTVRGRKLSASRIRVSEQQSNFSALSDISALSITGSLNVVALRIQSTTSISPTTLTQIANEIAAVDLRLREHSNNIASLDNDKDNDSIADVLNVFVNQSTAGAGEEVAFNLCAQAIINAGVTGYDHYICILPPDMNYSWYGQAYIVGNTAVINGNYASGYPNGLEHEMAHNWGRHHANTDGVEYGDSSCIMGGNAGTANRHFNAPQKLGLGWVSATTAGDDTYVLNAIETTSGTRLLKVRDTVANSDLYISTRKRIGNYSAGPIIPDTTHVHEWAGGSNKTFLKATLSNGQSYTQNGITITQISQNGTSATVSISGAGSCTRASPDIQISPANYTSQSLTPYTFSVTAENKDILCGSTTFTLSASSSSSELSTNISSTTISLAAGEIASVNLDAIPSSTLPNGSHTVTLSVSGDNHSNVNASAVYQYAPPTSTPVASPQPTQATTPTSVPPENDNSSPVLKIRNIKTNKVKSIKITYEISDDSNSTQDTIDIKDRSRRLIQKKLPPLVIPSNNRRTVQINSTKLTRKIYRYCVTSKDAANNSSKKCARVLITN